MSVVDVPELRAVESGLELFGREVTANMAGRHVLDLADGRRLIQAMTFVVNACFATTSSPSAYHYARRRGARREFDDLTRACTTGVRDVIRAVPALPSGSTTAQIEAAVVHCYDAAQPVLRAATTLVRTIKKSSHQDGDSPWRGPSARPPVQG